MTQNSNSKPEPEFDYDETQIWVFQLGEQFGNIEEMRVRPRGTSVVSDFSHPEEVEEVNFSSEERAWRKRGACRGIDPGIFFPAKGYSSLPAYSICIECPVRLQCLESSFGEKFGIWAGFSDSERARIQKSYNSNGTTLQEAMAPVDDKKYRKYQRAIRVNSPSLQYRGHQNGYREVGEGKGEEEED